MHKKICENNNIYVKSAKIIIYKKTKVCYYQGIERRKRGKEMLQTIENVNAAVNNFVWGVPAMVCIIGVGLVLSARTGFIQFRKFGYAIKNSIGRIFTKSEAKEGSITPFQAVCTALAATVGTGNIAGVAVRLQSEEQEQCSGCGCPHCLECVRSSQKLHLRFITERRMQREIMLGARCIISRTVLARNGTGWLRSMRSLEV